MTSCDEAIKTGTRSHIDDTLALEQWPGCQGMSNAGERFHSSIRQRVNAPSTSRCAC